MTRWPWFTMGGGTLFAVAPPSLKIVDAAFFAGEQLTQNIARPFVFGALAIFCALVLAEWAMRSLIVWRRHAVQAGKKMET